MASPKSCAILGHNPMRFAWGFDEEAAECHDMKMELAQQIMVLRQQGVTHFSVACDYGVGLYAAELINVLRDNDPELMLFCVTPYEEQATKWTPELRERYFDMLIKCTHNQIDARGDKPSTENEVFAACEEAVNEIFTLIKRLTVSANTIHYIITADHGFLYKRDKLHESDKISGIPNAGRRFALTTEKIQAAGVTSLPLASITGEEDGRTVYFPLGSDLFKAAGAGLNYVHGGSSPQELIVPLIDVKTEKGRRDTTTAQIALVSLTSKITNLITTLDFIQTEPVSDVVKETTYRLYFISDDNEKISNENIYIADKKDKDTTKRVFRLRFSFKNKKYDRSRKYYLVAFDDKNDLEVLRHEIIMDIAFADDFGFGF